MKEWKFLSIVKGFLLWKTLAGTEEAPKFRIIKTRSGKAMIRRARTKGFTTRTPLLITSNMQMTQSTSRTVTHTPTQTCSKTYPRLCRIRTKRPFASARHFATPWLATSVRCWQLHLDKIWKRFQRERELLLLLGSILESLLVRGWSKELWIS